MNDVKLEISDEVAESSQQPLPLAIQPVETDWASLLDVDDDSKRFELILYIAGTTARSSLALKNVKDMCESQLKGHYDLKVVDIYLQPALAKAQQILAVPTLIKKLPEPLQILIGDLSDNERVLVGLGLKAKGQAQVSNP